MSLKPGNETSCSLHVLQLNKKIFILNLKQTVFKCADKLKSWLPCCHGYTVLFIAPDFPNS